MSKHQLQFMSQNGPSTVFFDPQNIDNQLNVKVSSTRRSVGPDRIRQVRIDATSKRFYKYTSCNTQPCGVNDFAGANVVLYGATPSEVLLAWSDLKANMDAILAQNTLNGVPVPMNMVGLEITDAVKTTP